MLEKSSGVTPSEKYLASLCERTFLRLWSYPNLFKDQGKVGGRGDGKEVCDLAVVCGNDVILFSDKSCGFKDSCDLKTNWCRWFRRAIKKSADQLFGAQRWIQQFPERLFLDRDCKTRFPLDLSHINECRFHLVVVAVGAETRCRQELGGSGSLVLCPSIIGDEHTSEGCTPFSIGDLDPSKSFVHVFDAVTLDVILHELDTISDFVRYLTRKERFIRAGKLAFAAGEENLLACYASTMTNDGHDFVLPNGYKQLVVHDGHWKRHICSPEFRRKVEANRKSYIWDQLIEEFCRHTIDGTSLEGSTVSIADAESGYRIMAKEPRLNRRLLADAWVDRLATASKEKISIRTVLSKEIPDTGYVFATVPETIEDANLYRRFRRGYLDKYCFVLAWKHRLKRVVGIASEPGLDPIRSHDFMLFEPDEWTEQMEKDAEETQKSLGVLYERNLHKTPVHQDEYPAARTRPKTKTPRASPVHRPIYRMMPKIGRNEQCPCGSGKKFKKCCGLN